MNNIPNYIGRFRVKKELTRLLNYGNWIIYRDPEIGLYAYDPDSGEDVNLLMWNLTREEWNNKIKSMIIEEIRNHSKY